MPKCFQGYTRYASLLERARAHNGPPFTPYDREMIGRTLPCRPSAFSRATPHGKAFRSRVGPREPNAQAIPSTLSVQLEWSRVLEAHRRAV